ncbi:MAG: AsmA-like C-terminal domain-containing protein [Planctomycetota bacterium]
MKYRTISVLFFIAALLLILVAINIRIIFSSLITPSNVESILHDLFGEKFSVGSISFNAWRGIKISDIRLPLTDKGYDFLKVKTVRITYDQTKLIKGQFIVDKVILYNPEIYLIDNKIPHLRLKTSGNAPSPIIIVKNASVSFAHHDFLKADTTLKFKDVNIHFYPLVNGRYVIKGGSDGVELGGWKIQGELDTQTTDMQINLISQNTNIGDYLAERLNEKYYTIWHRYQPQGEVNLNIFFKLSNNQPLDMKIQMDCQKNDMTFEGFPYTLSNIEGQIEFTPSEVHLNNLKGTNGSTVVVANGYLEGYEKSDGFNIMLKVSNMSLDDKLYNAIPPQMRNIWNDLKPSGLMDAESSISKRSGINQDIHYNMKLYCRAVELTPSFFPYHITNASGEIEILDQSIKIKHLSAFRNKGEIKAGGDISIDANGQVENLAVKIDAKNIEINDYTLREATNKVIPDIDKFWSKSQPEGTINISTTLQKSSGNNKIDVKSMLQCNGISLKIGPSSLPITNVQGQIEYYSNYGVTQKSHISLSHLSAVYKETRFEIMGTIDNFNLDSISSSIQEQPKIALDIKVSNLVFDKKESYPILPANLKDLLQQIDFNGKVDASLKITTDGNEDSSPQKSQYGLNYTGELKLLDCGFKTGINFDNITGSLIIKGHYSLATNPDNNTTTNYMAGLGNISQIRIENKLINNLSVHFLQEKDHVRFDIKGNSYNGAISGFFMVSLPELTHPLGDPVGQTITSNDTTSLTKNIEAYEYQGRIELAGIDIKEFRRDTPLGNKDISGKFSAELDFNGKGMSKQALNVQGKASVINAQLWEVPVFLSIYNLFTLTEKSTFKEGEIRFTVSNGEMNIRRLIFSSKDVILKGAGKMKLDDGSLDIQFDAKFLKSIIPKIPIVEWLKEFFLKSIYTIKVEGTFSNPKAEIKPLPFLDIFK